MKKTILGYTSSLRGKNISRLTLIIAFLAVFAAGGFLYAPSAKAATGDVNLLVNDELGNGLTGATVTAHCTGTTAAFTDSGAGHYTQSTSTLASVGCVIGNPITFTAVKDGYVTTVDSTQYYTSGNPWTYTLNSGLKFAVKINAINELSNPATGATVTVGDGFTVTCVGNGIYYYCAVPVAQIGTAITINESGYVQQITSSGAYADRTANTDPQSTGTISNFQYAHKVLTGASGATVTAGSGNTSCVAHNTTYYCPVPASQDGGTNDITVSESGYITVKGSTGNRADDTSAQAVEDLTSTTNFGGSTDLGSFGLAVTISDELGNPLNNASPTFRGASPAYSSGNTYYFADTSGSGSLVMVNDGYVTGSDTIVTSPSGQVTKTYTGTGSNPGLQYAYKITDIASEVLGTSLLSSATTVALGNSTGQVSCTLSSGAYYCPVTLADSSGSITAHIAVDGYVEKSNYSTTFSTRTANTDPQRSDGIAAIGYAYKLSTFTAETTSAAVTPTAVTVGNSTGQVSCTLNSAHWYCAVPAADSSGTVNANVTSDGFVQADYAYTNRTSSTGSQVTAAVTGIKYAFKVTGVADELGNPLSTVTVTTGDSYGTTCTESGGAWYCAVPLANTGIAIKAAKDGYVTNSDTSFNADRTAAADPQQTQAVTGVQFAHKVTVTREGDDAALTDAMVTVDGASCVGGTGGVYYCAVPLASESEGSIGVVADGYKTASSATAGIRDSATSAQVLDTAADILFQLKVVVTDELGTALPISGLDLITFNEAAPTYSSGNTAYWAIAPATSATLVIRKDGYVDSGTVNTGFVANVTTAAGGETVITLGNNAARTSAIGAGASVTAQGLMYALKVTVERDGDNTAITGGSVTAGGTLGNPYTTTCTENGSSGVFYCAVPLADTGTVAKIVQSGYVTKYLNFTDRTAVTNPQGLITALLDAQDTSGASLSVDSIGTTANPAGSVGYASADGTYNNGWAWVFNITAPVDQTQFQLKFSDFTNGGNTIAVATSSAAKIIRYCSPQADDGHDCTDNAEGSGAWQVITSNTNYGGIISIPYSSDLDTTRTGNQIQIKVQMKVPFGSAGGSYSGSYGVQTQTTTGGPD